jgi:TatD DNase family protein
VPLESIVLETDSPYLVPSGVKARRNTPASVAIVAKALADLLERDVLDVARVSTDNVRRVFGFAMVESGGEKT